MDHVSKTICVVNSPAKVKEQHIHVNWFALGSCALPNGDIGASLSGWERNGPPKSDEANPT